MLTILTSKIKLINDIKFIITTFIIYFIMNWRLEINYYNKIIYICDNETNRYTQMKTPRKEFVNLHWLDLGSSNNKTMMIVKIITVNWLFFE